MLCANLYITLIKLIIKNRLFSGTFLEFFVSFLVTTVDEETILYGDINHLYI